MAAAEARRRESMAALSAVALFVLATAGFGALLEGYDQRLHPVGLLGASGIARAMAFGVLGFVLPGALAAWLAWRWREALPQRSPLAGRLGLQLALLAALAFAAQGVLPLDPSDLDARASRLHATAWMLWWIAFVPAALLLAWSAWRARPRRAVAFGLQFIVAAWVPAFAAWLPGAIAPGLAQRAAFAGWFAWLLWMACDRHGHPWPRGSKGRAGLRPAASRGGS